MYAHTCACATTHTHTHTYTHTLVIPPKQGHVSCIQQAVGEDLCKKQCQICIRCPPHNRASIRCTQFLNHLRDGSMLFANVCRFSQVGNHPRFHVCPRSKCRVSYLRLCPPIGLDYNHTHTHTHARTHAHTHTHTHSRKRLQSGI